MPDGRKKKIAANQKRKSASKALKEAYEAGYKAAKKECDDANFSRYVDDLRGL